MARQRDYPIIRFLIASFYALSALTLVGGLAAGGYLWIRAEALRDGVILGGPLSNALNAYDSSQLLLGAAAAAGGGLLCFLIFGAFGQMLAMQRDRAIQASVQTQLLEDILELSEEAAATHESSRVELCDGCGRLGSLHRIESGQWVCRECRRQLRSAS